jgi:hypothetical protein
MEWYGLDTGGAMNVLEALSKRELVSQVQALLRYRDELHDRIRQQAEVIERLRAEAKARVVVEDLEVDL